MLVKGVVGHNYICEFTNVAVEHLIQVVGERKAKVEVDASAGPVHLNSNIQWVGGLSRCVT